MTLQAEDVRHVANLARLDLSDNEVTSMTRELGTIVSYIEQLTEVDTEGVGAIANVAGLSNVTRPDQVGAMFNQTTALANAPQANQQAFLVPKAVER